MDALRPIGSMELSTKTDFSGNPTSKNKALLWYGFWFFLITVSYYVLRLNLIDIPLTRDEGGFAYFGRLIADGGILYRDGFDHKPPGVWLIYAALSHIVSFTPAGLHWMIHIYNYLVLICLSVISWRLFNLRVSLWTALIYSIVSSSYDFGGSGATAEMIMLLPIVLSVLFCILGLEKEKDIYILFSGFLIGIAFWIKQPAMAVMIFLICWMCIELIHSKGIKAAVWYVSLFTSGFIIISAALLVSFRMNGTWNEFIYWSFTHSISYASAGSINTALFRFAMQLRSMVLGMPFLWILIISFYLYKRKEKTRINYFLIFFLASSFLAAMHSAAMYRHYFALVCPALAINGGVAISTFIDIQKMPSLKTTWIFFGISGLVVLPIYININYYYFNTPEENSANLFGQTVFSESMKIAEYLKNNTNGSDKILILGSEPQILVLSNRKSATRHIFMYQVVGRYKRALEFQEHVIDDLKRNQPAYIVYIMEPYSWLAGKSRIDFIRKINKALGNKYKTEGVVIRKNNQSILMVEDEFKNLCSKQKITNNQISAYLLKKVY